MVVSSSDCCSSDSAADATSAAAAAAAALCRSLQDLQGCTCAYYSWLHQRSDRRELRRQPELILLPSRFAREGCLCLCTNVSMPCQVLCHFADTAGLVFDPYKKESNVLPITRDASRKVKRRTHPSASRVRHPWPWVAGRPRSSCSAPVAATPQS